MSDEARAGESKTPETDVFEYSIGDNETVIEAVLHAVSAVTNKPLSPNEEPVVADGGRETLPPLHDVIDPDALTRLTPPSTNGTEWEVAFPYAGCEVTVRSGDTVSVRVITSS